MVSSEIRTATAADLAAINEIYNHYVPISTTTYALEPSSLVERRQWFANRKEIHPVTVACRDGTVVGWGSLNSFRDKEGYRHTVEDSVYVHPDCQRQGIGTALLADLVDRARRLGLRSIVAGIDTEQAASIELHRKFGFVEVAHFREVGYKFDRWLDVYFMQLILDS
jgi:phosphinothricin acetyltransferase